MRLLPMLCLMALAGCQEEFADWPEAETTEAALGTAFATALRADPAEAPLDLASAGLELRPGLEPVDLN